MYVNWLHMRFPWHPTKVCQFGLGRGRVPIFTAIWALTVLPIWLLLVRLPAAMGSKATWVPTLLLGYLVGTWLMLRADHRVGPLVIQKPWWPRQPSRALLAFIAGLGIAILASELGNIGEDLLSRPLPIQDPSEYPGAPWPTAFLVGVVHPACFMVVLVGIAQRRLLMLEKPHLTLMIIVFLGTLGVPLPQLGQGALIVFFPAWLYMQTEQLGLAISAYLPSGLVAGALVLGLGPKIQGFDVMLSGQPAFQPIWFSATGALLVAVGVAGLAVEFEGHG